jgi:hypothetical protein
MEKPQSGWQKSACWKLHYVDLGYPLTGIHDKFVDPVLPWDVKGNQGEPSAFTDIC